MKKIVKFAMVSLFVMMAVACSDKEYAGNGYLEVTPNNISGAWSMESYDNGVPLADGSYYYIVFDRAERRFESFDNLGSMEMYKRSGRYDINTNGAAIIRGIRLRPGRLGASVLCSRFDEGTNGLGGC